MRQCIIMHLFYKITATYHTTHTQLYFESKFLSKLFSINVLIWIYIVKCKRVTFPQMFIPEYLHLKINSMNINQYLFSCQISLLFIILIFKCIYSAVCNEPVCKYLPFPVYMINTYHHISNG